MNWPTDIGHIRLVDDLDALSGAEIEQLQAWNLTALVEAASARPSVRKRFPGVEKVKSRADLARLPIMSPAELAADGPPHTDALLLGGPGGGLVLRSSGTSSHRKVLYHTWEFSRRVALLGARGVRAALRGRTATEPLRIANCLHAAGLNGAFTFAQDIGQLLPALIFPCGAGFDFGELAELIAEHRIDVVVGTSSYLAEMAEVVGPSDRPHTLLYIGEEFGASHRRAVEGALPGAIVRSLAYSTTEIGPIGYQCPAVGDGTHHIHEDAVVVEVVDAGGAPVPAGEIGEIVVTPLTDSGMALFRYRIGDRGVLHDEPCPCGSRARLLTLAGRADQSIIVDGYVISSDLLRARLTELGVRDEADYQLQVIWRGWTYRVRLLLEADAASALTRDTVAARLRGSYHLDAVLGSRRCTGFEVARADRSAFARTERGKVPLLLQQREDG